MARASELAKAGCKYLGVAYTTMDCQAFVERCLKDVGAFKNLPGSNAWYREMTWVGSPEECKARFGEIPRGAFLFIHAKDGKEPEKYRKDGIGNASHIGIYTGMTGAQMVLNAADNGNSNGGAYNHGDGAIHSSASKGSVCTSNFKGKTINGGWNKVGLWNKIDYNAAINQRLGSQMANPEPVVDDSKPIGTGIVFAESGTTVKMRQRPSTGCGIYWNVPIGETVDILQNGDWIRIRWNGKVGYIRQEFVRVGENMATIEPNPEKAPVLAMVWAESGNTVKMRYRPDTSCPLYEKVPIGTQVAVNQKGDLWCKISVGNRSEWYMMTRFLKFEED